MATIIIADDHNMFINGLKMILQSKHEVLQTVNDGLELLEVLKSQVPDLVLMDINMPKLNGYEAMLVIHKLYPDLKVIAVSMLADTTSVAKMLEAGVDGYLYKNADEAELFTAIDTVLQHDYYVTEEMKSVLHAFQRKLKDIEKGYEKQHKPLLSHREIEILKLIMEGMTNAEIADEIHLSVRTVDTHRKNILAKLDLKNTAALVKYAMEKGAFLGL